MDKKSRETLVCMAWNEVNNDPEWIELKKERDRKIKLIEDDYHRKYLKIRDKYWKKYGLFRRVKAD